MTHATTCTTCGALYEESSEETANAPERECVSCFNRRLALGRDGDCDALDARLWSERYPSDAGYAPRSKP